MSLSLRRALLLCASLLFMLGLVMIFSTTSADVLDHDLERSTHQAMLRQIGYACAGFGLGALILKIGYRELLRISPTLLVVFTILLFLTLIPGIGRTVNGSRRWLGIGGFSFQPSEFVKYFVPAYFIHYLLPFQGQVLPLKVFLSLVGIVSVPLFLILIEPNNGTVAVIGMVLIAVCFLMKVPIKFWAMPLMAFVLIGGVFALNLPYVTARLRVYLNPELDLKGKGHQPYQAKIAAGSGEFFGKGPGNSWQKLSYLPEAQNDYIAAIYAEEFGFLGIFILISLYMTLALLGFAIAQRCTDPAGCYFAGAVVFLISLQAFLNLGVVSGLLPSTGLNLPLFSQGGTSLLANMMGVAFLLDVGKSEHRL